MKGTLGERLTDIEQAAQPSEQSRRNYYGTRDLERLTQFDRSTFYHYRPQGLIPEPAKTPHPGNNGYRFSGHSVYKFVEDLRTEGKEGVSMLWDIKTPLWRRDQMLDYIGMSNSAYLRLSDNEKIPYYSLKRTQRYSPFEIAYWLEHRRLNLDLESEIYAADFRLSDFQQPLMRLDAIADYFGYKRQTVKVWMRKGTLNGYKFTKKWKARRREIVEWKRANLHKRLPPRHVL